MAPTPEDRALQPGECRHQYRSTDSLNVPSALSHRRRYGLAEARRHDSNAYAVAS